MRHTTLIAALDAALQQVAALHVECDPSAAVIDTLRAAESLARALRRLQEAEDEVCRG